MAYYYDIWVSTKQFRSSSTLTYSSEVKLNPGVIITAPFRSKSVLGLVKAQVEMPEFKTRPISAILHKQSLPKSSISLFKWLINYYPSTASSHLQLFLPSGIEKIKESYDISGNINSGEINIPPALTDEQSLAINTIRKSKSRTFLIHGNTGSGKTRVYIELIKGAIDKLESTILLIPEIGLSPQIIESLENYFPNKVVAINSGLSEKIKRNNWERILTSKTPIIVVGPRSALFMPVNNLGLIIIDEAHDDSYKQENAPFYQATRVAAKLAEITDSRLILGTASPLISDYYLFERKKIPIIRMKKSAVSSSPDIAPNIAIVNLADKSLFSKSSWLSDILLKSIEKSLLANEQSLIFLNRRGTAAVVMCQNCGWKALCPNCNTSLTYHQDQHKLICHSCGYKDKSPSACPDCNNHDIVYRGVGTKAVEAELNKFFPKHKIQRFDRDNLKKDSLGENYTNLSQGKTDIIIGTQIITKGLDLPRLTTVGIVMADQNLAFPDFSSEEKNYQTLLQVMGRVGRGHQESSNIVIQTYNPESKALIAATAKDYDTFYNDQLDSRKKYLFPPFVYMLKVYCKKTTPQIARKSCEQLIESIRSLGLPVKISDSTPAFHEQVNGKYIWQFVIKSKNRQSLLDIVLHIPNDWFYDIDPINLL